MSKIIALVIAYRLDLYFLKKKEKKKKKDLEEKRVKL
jgi:hypothetical protein